MNCNSLDIVQDLYIRELKAYKAPVKVRASTPIVLVATLHTYPIDLLVHDILL